MSEKEEARKQVRTDWVLRNPSSALLFRRLVENPLKIWNFLIFQFCCQLVRVCASNRVGVQWLPLQLLWPNRTTYYLHLVLGYDYV